MTPSKNLNNYSERFLKMLPKFTEEIATCFEKESKLEICVTTTHQNNFRSFESSKIIMGEKYKTRWTKIANNDKWGDSINSVVLPNPFFNNVLEDLLSPRKYGISKTYKNDSEELGTFWFNSKGPEEFPANLQLIIFSGHGAINQIKELTTTYLNSLKFGRNVFKTTYTGLEPKKKIVDKLFFST